MFERRLRLPERPKESFFLWGPRQTGKSSLLKAMYPSAVWVDLLRSDEYMKYLQRPSLLREEVTAEAGPGTLVVIDEVQKVPLLLDEAHWLIENRGLTFALCGSSARKVRRGHANLLGGRALRFELHGLTSSEIGSEFRLARALNHGYLPRHYLSDRPAELLRSYVGDYLKEEVAAEGLVRNLSAFSDFLEKSSLSDTELVNFSNIARDCGVSPPTVESYFSILTDTMLGRWLPAYRGRPKRRVITGPKFYFSDVGVVNQLAKRGTLQPGSELFGKAFENWVFHELDAHREYSRRFNDISYWRLAGGTEVDFILGPMETAVEAKATRKVTSDHLRGLRTLIDDHPRLSARIVVCLESKRRITPDGIRILPAGDFARMLWNGDLAARA